MLEEKQPWYFSGLEYIISLSCYTSISGQWGTLLYFILSPGCMLIKSLPARTLPVIMEDGREHEKLTAYPKGAPLSCAHISLAEAVSWPTTLTSSGQTTDVFSHPQREETRKYCWIALVTLHPFSTKHKGVYTRLPTHTSFMLDLQSLGMYSYGKLRKPEFNSENFQL